MAPARAGSGFAHRASNVSTIVARGPVPFHPGHHRAAGEPHLQNQPLDIVAFPYYPFGYDIEPDTRTEVLDAGTRVAPEPEEKPVEEKRVSSPQLIEITGAVRVAATPLPPTIFILLSGEKLEAQQFLLTASSLSVTMHRAHRTIAIDMLDLDATLAANHNRGIELRIPNDRNEISLRF